MAESNSRSVAEAPVVPPVPNKFSRFLGLTVVLAKQMPRDIVRWFSKTNPEKTSRTGYVIQALGVVSLLIGLHGIYAPLAYLAGGAVLVVIGEKS